MARSDKIYPSPSNLHRKHRRQLFKGEAFHPEIDWNAIEADRSTTVSTTTWTTDDDTVITISNASLSVATGIAECKATADQSGAAQLKNSTTFADGSVAVVWWKIVVKDDG